MQESPEIRLVRETLESVAQPATASAILFRALQMNGSLPQTPADMLEVLRGPIKTLVSQELGEDIAEEVMNTVEPLLERFAAGTPAPPLKSDDVTWNVNPSEVSLLVLVLANSERFANQLAAALGPQIMIPIVASDRDTMVQRIGRLKPAFVLVDASDVPHIEPHDLVSALKDVDRDVVKGLWGHDLPYGRGLLDAAKSAEVDISTFDRQEGIAPLMDVIRSRRKQ